MTDKNLNRLQEIVEAIVNQVAESRSMYIRNSINYMSEDGASEITNQARMDRETREKAVTDIMSWVHALVIDEME